MGSSHIDFDAVPAAEPAASHINFDAAPSGEGSHIDFDAPQSSAVGAFTRGVTHNIVPAIVGAAGAVGGAALGTLAGPGGVIAGDVGGAVAGTALGEKIQRSVLPEKTVSEMDAQEAADREAHPIASSIGAMVGQVPLMLTGGGIPTAIARSGLKRAGVEATEAAVKAGAEKILPRVARSASTFAGMSGGEAAAEKVKGAPGSENISIANEALKGAVGGAVMGAIPGMDVFKSSVANYIGKYFAKPVTDAAVLSVSNGVYDHAVNGKVLDPFEIAKSTGESIPAFMVMNIAAGMLHAHPQLKTVADSHEIVIETPELTALAKRLKEMQDDPRLTPEGRELLNDRLGAIERRLNPPPVRDSQGMQGGVFVPGAIPKPDAEIIGVSRRGNLAAETDRLSGSRVREAQFGSEGTAIPVPEPVREPMVKEVVVVRHANEINDVIDRYNQRNNLSPSNRIPSVEIPQRDTGLTEEDVRRIDSQSRVAEARLHKADGSIIIPGNTPRPDAVVDGGPTTSRPDRVLVENQITRPQILSNSRYPVALFGSDGKRIQTISRPDAVPVPAKQVGASSPPPAAQDANSTLRSPTSEPNRPDAPGLPGGTDSSRPDPAAPQSQASPDAVTRAEVKGGSLTPDEVAAKAHEASTSPLNATPPPTEAQRDAGNYKKGHIKVHGLDIAIENPAGSKRRPEWNNLEDHYGYIKGTIGKDKDHVDVFVNRDNPESDKVFVVNQVDPKTGRFDEHKAVMGAKDADEAKAIYERNYQPGWKGGDSIVEMTIDQFKKWVKSPATGKPAEKMGDVPTGESAPSLDKIPTVELPIDSVKLSKDVPNFKENANDRGVVAPLKGKYQRLGTGPIVVWERTDGSREVITGRHRLDLAKRTGEKTIPAQVVRESDGFTQAMAFRLDAEANIRDNQGGVKDYANYFKSTGITEQEASSRGLLSRSQGRDGFSIGTKASDDLYALYRSGGLTDAKAAAIADAAPGNAELQSIGAAYAKGHSAEEVSAYLKAVQASKPSGESTLDLFGRDDAWQLEADKMAKAVMGIQGRLKAEYAALRSARSLSKDKFQEVLKKYGFKKGDTASVEKRLAELDHEINAWDHWSTDPARVDQVRKDAGIEPKKEDLPPLEVQTPEQVKAEREAKEKAEAEKAAESKRIADKEAKERDDKARKTKPLDMTADLIDVRDSENPLFAARPKAPESSKPVEKSATSPSDAAHQGTLEAIPQGRGKPLLAVEATTMDGKKARVPARDVDTLKGSGPYKSIRVLDTKGNDVTEKFPLKVKVEPTPDAPKFRDTMKEAPAPLRRDAEKLLRKMLGPNFSLDQVDSLMAGGLDRLGSYYNKVLTVVGKGDQNRTFFHEAWHGLRDVLTVDEQAKIDRIEPSHEKQADAFMEYAMKNGEGFTGQLKRYLDRAWFRLKQLFGAANGADEMKAMHARMLDGTYGNRGEVGAGSTEPAYRTQLEDLRDELKPMGKGAAQLKPGASDPYTAGKRVAEIKDFASSVVNGIKTATQIVREAQVGMPKITEWRKLVGVWSAEVQHATRTAWLFKKDMARIMPDKRSAEAVQNYLDAGGDVGVLTRSRDTAKPQYKQGYHDALNLTPEQKVFAEKVRKYYDAMADQAIREGWMKDALEHYINRRWESDSPWKKGKLAELNAATITTGKPEFLKKRFYEYNVDAENAGVKTVKDVRESLLAYDYAFRKSMADRAFVKGALDIKMADGRPMIDVSPYRETLQKDENGNKVTEKDATFIKPYTPKEDPNDPTVSRAGYVAFDHPAFRGWKWAANDSDGKPIYVQGSMWVHPDAVKQIQAFMGRSKIRDNVVGRTLLKASSTVKQTMLDMSGFHMAQIGIHALEHRVNPFKRVQIDFNDAVQRKLIEGGLMVSDTHGMQQFMEGNVGQSLSRHIPYVGEQLGRWNEWLFKEYIPSIKMTMALHAVERNRKVFEKDIASGKMSEDQLFALTAGQGNAAFGELNYDVMGRSKTTQDVLRLFLLAPDFLEARGRFASQAMTKYGTEQRVALALGAATLYVAARAFNKIVNDDYHFEPENAFSAVYGSHSYTLRTVQGDILHMLTDPGKFTANRLNPLYGRTALEFMTKRDSFGRTRTGQEQLQDLASQMVPISFRNSSEQKMWESFLNSFAVSNKRWSVTNNIQKLAEKFKADNKVSVIPGEFIYDPEKDPYRGIKNALAGDHLGDAIIEYKKALKAGDKTPEQIAEHFKKYSVSQFTGSRKNEAKFRASLTSDQRREYDQAVTAKRKIGTDFLKVKSMAY